MIISQDHEHKYNSKVFTISKLKALLQIPGVVLEQ